MFYCLWKAHVEQIPNEFFSFRGMFSLCAVKHMWKTCVEIRLNLFYKVILFLLKCIIQFCSDSEVLEK